MSNVEAEKMEKIIALCKRRGFVYQGSEIYGGLAGTWDYGPFGVKLKNNIKNLWWKRFVDDRSDMYGVDAAILMNQKVWQATGHVGGFADPLVECTKCKKRFRADQLKNKEKCEDCGGKLGAEKQFNLMFKTHVGVSEDESSVSYLRPETAQGIFVNFKNVVDSFHPKLPFGIAQIGKAFRNEISARDFLFRVRELEQMEIEYFVNEKDWAKYFEEWRINVLNFAKDVGIDSEKVHELEVAPEDRAHYSKRTIDFEFDFPFGRKELYGLAYRTDHDLKSHMRDSGVDLTYFDEETKEKFVPHVIEPSLGVDRTVLAILSSVYTEDAMGEGGRVFLKFPPAVAPVKAAVFPLMKNKPELVEKATELFMLLRSKISNVIFDDNGNVGKRYRRQDEIGTPYCLTVDYQTLEDGTVTVRDRDTGKQERILIGEAPEYIKARIS